MRYDYKTEIMKSYKIYARIISIISALLIIIASLDATQVINLFPEYASQINTILVIAGILAPIVAQEKRVVRAEDLVKEDVIENIPVSLDVDVSEDDLKQLIINYFDENKDDIVDSIEKDLDDELTVTGEFE